MRNKQEITVDTIPLTRARRGLSEVLKRVHLNKEYIVIEKGGIPIAGIMDIGEFEDYLELQNPNIQRQIKKSRQDYQARKSRPARKPLAELRGEKPKARRRKKV